MNGENYKNQENYDDLLNLYVKNLKPIDEINGFKVRPGFYDDYGTVVIPGGVSFSVHSQHATAITLALFKREASEPYAMIPFPDTYRVGHVYAMIVFGLDIEEFEYAYVVDGPWDPEEGMIFDKTKYLLDPYARAVAGQSEWGVKLADYNQYHARVVASEFDWGNSKQPYIPMEDLIIYELHVRGFTNDPSSKVTHRGTFAGLMEKIPYLLELGVNAVELMHIFEFDETLDRREVDGKVLLDYWGYNPVCFFAPNTSYTADQEYNREGKELKTLIKKLNENGIEVFLDVVFNHTAEGNEKGPYISLKGLDNNVYYMLTPDGKYYNFSGCGNTLNCNHPVVQRMILDCLRYWVIEYRVDGFRFDLASILGRDEDGNPMKKPPLLQNLAFDPVLANVKLIAEAWDAGGLYQVGTFSSLNRWSEWNGKYRDDLRRFLKGDPAMALEAAERMAGSIDLYDPAYRGLNASVNFITCHDGFTLNDLYSYNNKHNESNGWNNTDGEDHNHSWNCGVEGMTDDPEVLALRRRMMKNAIAVLLASHGTPMLLAGDEFGNTQWGNNNAYCQDNEISWINWRQQEENQELFQFTQKMIQVRKNHPVLRAPNQQKYCGFPLMSKHGVHPWHLDDWDENRVIGVMFAGRTNEDQRDEVIYVAVNAHWEEQTILLPSLAQEKAWHIMVDTSQPAGDEINLEEEKMPRVIEDVNMHPRSVMLFKAISYGSSPVKK